MKKIFTHLFAVLLMLFVSASAWAQETSLADGKVYHFQNVGNKDVALAASALTDVAAVAVNKEQTSQHWYCQLVDGYYTFRNLSNGKYLKGNSSSGDWSLTDGNTDAANKFNLVTVGSNNTIYSTSHQQGDTGGGGSMHRDNGNNIVGWGADNSNSQWTITVVEYTEEQLAENWAAVENFILSDEKKGDYATKLYEIFDDKACTKLKATYAEKTLDEIKADPTYTGLPAVLQAMVVKVYNEQVSGSTTAWAESTVAPADRPNGNNNTNHNLWTVEETWNNDYAKKFRVQMYEPYSVEGEITSFLRINSHSNMDNPTGIYANFNQLIYIMVEGTIEDGAELWVAHQSGHGATAYYTNVAYTELHEGLNIVPYFADGCQLWINYLVHTYDSNTGTFMNKLSDFAPLKIHIEGGHINGFFNAMGDYRSTEVSGDVNGGENLWGEVDNDADWDYYKARVALSDDFALLGHRQTLLFPFGTWSDDILVPELDENGNVKTNNNGETVWTRGPGFGVVNDSGDTESALAYWLEHIEVPTTPNCYGGSGNTFGDYSEAYYPGMNLVTGGTLNKINIMLEAWDRIMYSEHATMGLLSKPNIDKMNSLYPGWTAENTTFDIYNYGSKDTGDTYKAFCKGRDYSEYYNHHGVAVGSGSGYMSGGERVCNYHYNTMGSIIGKIAVEPGPTWGPAHEIGHQHQRVFNLNGQTEITNNFFSNVAVWYMGMGTSRVNDNYGSLESLLALFNNDETSQYLQLTQGNHIWALTHLYYRLWLYYHLAGNNTQFWPRLFELCRQTPLENGTQISGETSLLRFYRHACKAAGEDLTEFFRAHGYFDVMDNVFVGDYQNATYNMTQKQINDAIDAVKSEGYPVNYAVLLINDGTSETTVMHDGTKKRTLWDGNASAEFGSVTDFIEGNTSVTEVYEATVSADGTVTMSGGEGGVGFLVLNEKGELVSFSNKSTFEISDEAVYLLATGKASIVAVDADSKKTAAEVDLSAIQLTLIYPLIDKVAQILKFVDGTCTKVGYYKEYAVEDLQTAFNIAKKTIETGEGLAAAYELLHTEYRKVMDNDDAKVEIVSGAKYAIMNCGYKFYMTVSGDNVVTTGKSTFPTTDDDLWIIETAGENFHIKHAGTRKYLQEVSNSDGVQFTIGNAAVDYKMTNLDTEWYAFSTVANSGRYMNCYNKDKVATYWATDNNSRWSVTLAEDDVAAMSVSAAKLQALIEKTEALVNTVAEVSFEVPLQASDPTAPYYITSNATEGGHEPKYLLDGATATFFHTVWNGSSPGEHHYLLIDFGEENPIGEFAFEYTNTNSNNVDAAKSITVEGANSNDGPFTIIETLTSDDSDNPLPIEKLEVYSSSILGTAGTPYRYIKLTVTDATGVKFDGYNYFGMAELSVTRCSGSAEINADYTNYVTQAAVLAAAQKVLSARTALEEAVDLSTIYNELFDVYESLYSEYKGAVDAEKEKLLKMISDTEELIEQVGKATVAADVEIDLHGKLYAEKPYEVEGLNHSDYSSAENGYNLLDGNVGTHFHSDYNFATMPSKPYIRVDLGEGNVANKFEFNYTTRNQDSCAPTTLNVYGSNEQNDGYTKLKTFTSADATNPLPTAISKAWTSDTIDTIEFATAYRYFKFEVEVSQGYKEENSVRKYFFAISEFGFKKIGEVSAEVYEEYKQLIDEELLIDTRRTVDASEAMVGYAEDYKVTVKQIKVQYATIQLAYDRLQNTKELSEVINKTQALYDEMSGDYYSTAEELTTDMLEGVANALATAKNICIDSNFTISDVSDISAATSNLNELYSKLDEIKSKDFVGEESRKGLEDLIIQTNSIIETVATVNGDDITIKTEYVSPNMSVEIVSAAKQKADEAADEIGKYMTESDYETTLKELQDAYDALNLAKNLGDIPVILTTDVNNPVLYKIKVKSNGTMFTYEGKDAEASKKLKLNGNEMGNRYQAWYFMEGNNSNSYEDILIIPYWYNNAQNTTLKLGYPNINEETESVASTEGAMSYNWYLKFTEGKTAEGYWNLQPEDGASVNAYVNQYGGGSATKLAFWLNASNPESSGSQFQFIPDETDYSLSDAYYALYNKHAEFGGTLTGGEAIGDYTVASVAAYNEAYNNAGALLEAKTSTDDVYTTARETLAGSFAAIEYVMPEEGKLYMIRSISTQDYCSGKYVHALCDTRQGYTDQNHKHLVFDALGDITQLPLAVFTFENVNANGECKMKNLHTGMYVKSFNKGYEHMTTDYASAAIVKIGNFAPGQAILRIGNENPMHAQEANRVIVGWRAEAGNASLWSIDEVTDISQVVHNVTMSATFSSVMLGYNAKVPAGVKAYIATGIDGGYVSLEEVAVPGKTLPAGTPVILYRTDDATSKVFTYSEETPVSVDGESLLGGSLYLKYVACEEGKDYYKLMLKNGEAKMYWMYKEFDANGESTDSDDKNAGGHIKCSANKIYMALPNSDSNPVTMFGMRFIDDSATGIDGVKGESGEVKAIYDLQGRKLTEITEPGMYIVDGKKVYVK